MAATPQPAVVPALRRLLHAPGTCVVVLSGRPVHELEALLPLSLLPELWGVHGWERRTTDGRVDVVALPPDAQAVLAREHERLVAAGVGPQLERKSATLALHWRGLGTQEALALQDLVTGPWTELGAKHGFVVRPFDGGTELRHAATDKGRAVLALLRRAPDAPLAYLGDDDTDEDAFRALAQPEFATRTLGVRVRTVPAATAASAELAPADVPELLVQWLDLTRRVRA
jgi:trehalose-phosphatase